MLKQCVKANDISYKIKMIRKWVWDILNIKIF